MSKASTTLSTLVSATAPLLAYSIPLLIISIPLTFAGTFLTLDRSRSFPSSYGTPVTLPGAFDGPKKLSKLKFPLQGGVGGLFSGYLFGIHLSTFLSLLIPVISSSDPLSSNSFLAVWILSCILTTILGGRYRYCARIFAAITGGSSLSLAISVIIHPPLLPRQILTGLFAALSTLLVLIFSLPRLARILRHTLSVFTASSGAFSLVLSVALLAHVPAWADIWERLWLSDGDSWGTSKEQGLSTFCVVLCIAGIAADFALNHWLGECPDEKWDNFLANYSANLPSNSDRTGTFHPLPSFWDRLRKTSSRGTETDGLLPLTFPDDARNSIAKEPPDLLSDDDYDKDFAEPPILHGLTTDNSPPAFLKKVRSSQNAKYKRRKRGRGFQDVTSARKQPIKFGQDLSSDSSDEDSDEPQPRDVRPWLKQKASMSSSSPTLVDQPTTMLFQHHTNNSGHKLKQTQAETESGPSIAPVYSDYEEDIGISKAKFGIANEDTVWRPGFMKRYSSSAGVSNVNGAATSSTSSRDSAPIGAVPVTPSLLKALDRISVAQREAFGSVTGSTLTSTRSSDDFERKGSITRAEGLPKVPETDIEDNDYSDVEVGRKGQLAPRWEEFWNEVKHKAVTS